jgi:hypothetical protein
VQLGDLSNTALVLLQQPGAQYTVGGGTTTGPTWSSLNNPQFSQGLVEFAINQGYKKVMGDIEDIELALVSFTLSSTAVTSKYAIPPADYAQISHVARVSYQPFGLPYTYEYKKGYYLVSWDEYQKLWTGQGYLQPYAFGTQPQVAAVDPLRQNLYFYPGSARAGDTITVYYTPIPTNPIGGTVTAIGCPILVAPTDNPIIPDDCDAAILYYALGLLWVRAREQAIALMYYNPSRQNPGWYQNEIELIRQKYLKVTHGDVLRVGPQLDSLSLTRPY